MTDSQEFWFTGLFFAILSNQSQGWVSATCGVISIVSMAISLFSERQERKERKEKRA